MLVVYGAELRLVAMGLAGLAVLTQLWPHRLAPDPLWDVLLKTVATSAAATAATYWLVKGWEPGKYLLVWYWTFYTASYLLKISIPPEMPFGPLNHPIKAYLYAIPSAITSMLIRLPKRGEEGSWLDTRQLWTASLLLTAAITVAHLAKADPTPLLYAVAAGLPLSMIAVGRRLAFNLSLAPLLAAAAVDTAGAQVHPLTHLFIFATGLAYFWAATEILSIEYRGHSIPIAVAMGKTAMFFAPIAIALAWHLTQTHIGYLDPLTEATFPALVFTTVLGITLTDTLKGRKIGGIVGAYGLADGLWLYYYMLYLYTTTVKAIGPLFGTITYAIIYGIVRLADYLTNPAQLST
ncbi:hypothetical protein [Pyrobaculum sp.]|uniref:hypothetical protein n=1 Tax=Pyrobaculum sp. TaxID=2004705 RepID=UPI003D0D922B